MAEIVHCRFCGAINSIAAGDPAPRCLKCEQPLRRNDGHAYDRTAAVARRLATWVRNHLWAAFIFGMIVALVTPWLIWRSVFGEYEHRWIKVWDPAELEFKETRKPLHSGDICEEPYVLYIDRYRRWDDSIVHREIRFYPAGSFYDWPWPTIETYGPMTRSGKRHGHWVIRRYDEKDVLLLREVVDEWFWYGEPVSEGEWHLRNR